MARIIKTGLTHCLIFLFSQIIIFPIHASETDTHVDQLAGFIQKGDFAQAILSGNEAVSVYGQKGMIREQVTTLVYLSKAYQSLGKHRESLDSLNKALDLTKKNGDDKLKATVITKLGNAYIFINKLDEAEMYLKQALTIATANDALDVKASALNNLGNLYTLNKAYKKAMAAYKESALLSEKTDNQLLAARVMANIARVLLIQDKDYPDIKKSLDSSHEKHNRLPPSHDKAYGLINIGKAYCQLASSSYVSQENLKFLAAKILTEAASVAQEIDDYLAASYAFGYLGQIYEEDKRYIEATDYTRQALFYAQEVNAPESLYLWQWQNGRVFEAEGKIENAIAAYRNAVSTLQKIRQEMLADCRIFNQLSFQHAIEPLYFDLADILLKHSDSIEDQTLLQSYYSEVRTIMELLKAAELQDYFQDACVIASRFKMKEIDSISPESGIIYAIPLPDRLELLLVSHAGIKRFTVNVKAEDFYREIDLLRKTLQDREELYFIHHAQKLYHYMIDPIESQLHSQRIDTLIFVPYGPMHAIPMAALHNGKEFLINQFAVAVTPGLTLTDRRPFQRKHLEILLAGLSKSVRGFPPLVNVSKELEAIQSLYKSKILLDDHFRLPLLKEEFENVPYSILHIASHADFFENSEETFILSWDARITMNELQEIISSSKFRKEPVDLLTLSACVTAEGSDRAALGLAGVAVKAGAKSTLASLWEIDDYSTYKLIIEFYRQLQNQDISKAKALQQAQIKLINDQEFSHPYYWAPFLLIGNWL